jgi:hypothetical protein
VRTRFFSFFFLFSVILFEYVIHFLALRLKMMNFGIDFLIPEPKKMNYLCIELNLFGIDLMLRLKISHR